MLRVCVLSSDWLIHRVLYVRYVPLSLLWFSPGTLVSSTNKNDRHDIAEILLKVALNTIKPIQTILHYFHLF